VDTTIGQARPLLELSGVANRIDLSAWISGLSFSAGLAFCPAGQVAGEFLNARAGLYLVALTITVFLAAVVLIQRHMRLSLLANSFGSPRRLVTSGPFRYSRNPIYVAFFIPLASIAYFSISAAIAATGLYILAMNLTVIRKEERELLAAFGADYAALSQSTPRWII
jgi:protein-S-isoprenylcysteine O-methyltransferase Ste14